MKRFALAKCFFLFASINWLCNCVQFLSEHFFICASVDSSIIIERFSAKKFFTFFCLSRTYPNDVNVGLAVLNVHNFMHSHASIHRKVLFFFSLYFRILIAQFFLYFLSFSVCFRFYSSLISDTQTSCLFLKILTIRIALKLNKVFFVVVSKRKMSAQHFICCVNCVRMQ